MRWSARTVIVIGLGVGVVASGAAALWLHERPNTSAHTWQQAADPIMQGASKDIAALEAEVQRLKGETEDSLMALRSQLARVDQDQESSGDKINRIADKINRADLDGLAVPAANDDKADSAPLTPEEEGQREAARTQTEIGLMEATLRAEKADPEWANTAQLALHTTLHNGALPGVQMVGAECRATLCRMELMLDGSTAQESFRNLFDLAPWSGQSLIQLDTETGLAVMYLAREEHALPQLTE
jgi:hypothetical protein